MSGDASASRLVRLARTAYADPSAEALRAARLHLMDALAVGLLASAAGPVRGVRQLADSDAGTCTVLGSPRRASEAVAALVNGSLIHSLEFDDTHVASVMHGGAVMAPAALACAEDSGASGRDLLAAFAVGWEVLIRIGLSSPGRIQARGFQITSAAGAFAAALVSGLLHGDDDDVIANAVGIAGSQAAGTFAFLRDGDTVKAVQPGWSAHAGIMAAQLARTGVTGPNAVFEGRYGFFALYADDPEAADALAVELDDLGSRWHLAEAAYKLLPCCHYIHPFVEALDRMTADGVSASEIVALHCWVPTGAAPVIAEPWPERQRPAKAHDARWSLPYVLALAIRNGRITAADFDGTCEEDVMALAERITYEPWPDSGFPQRFPARLRAQLVDGSSRDVMVEDVLGGLGRPIEAAHVESKARGNLAQAGFPDDRIDAFVAALLGSEELDLGTLRAVMELR